MMLGEFVIVDCSGITLVNTYLQHSLRVFLLTVLGDFLVQIQLWLIHSCLRHGTQTECLWMHCQSGRAASEAENDRGRLKKSARGQQEFWLQSAAQQTQHLLYLCMSSTNPSHTRL